MTKNVESLELVDFPIDEIGGYIKNIVHPPALFTANVVMKLRVPIEASFC